MEKAAPKRGVIQQSVKEVVQALVDDNEVHQVHAGQRCASPLHPHLHRSQWHVLDQEKIGISNFFWAFPGERVAKVSS